MTIAEVSSFLSQGPVVQSVVSLTSSLRVISLTVLADSIYNILIFFAEKMWVAFALQKLLTFFSKQFQHICISLDVNFNESLTNDVVSRPRWLSWMRRLTGDQEVAGSTPAEVGNILSWRLIMKYFLRSFSPFRWFKKGSCQFLAKECAQYWLTTWRTKPAQ